MISHTIVVPGRPVPQGNMRAFAVNNRAFVTHKKPKELGDFRARVAIACQGIEMIFGPVALDVIFYLPRPKSHYGTGKNANKLKNSAPTYVTTNPDIDKILRSALDSLTGIAFRDDSQVVSITARKTYGNPQTVLTIQEVSERFGEGRVRFQKGGVG